MTSETNSGGNGFLYFIVGALVVAVGVLGVMYFNGGFGQSSADSSIERSADAIGDAADEVGDAAESIGKNNN